MTVPRDEWKMIHIPGTDILPIKRKRQEAETLITIRATKQVRDHIDRI